MKIYVTLESDADLAHSKEKLAALKHLVDFGCELTISTEGRGTLLIRELEDREVRHSITGAILLVDKVQTAGVA